ncbi:MAG TPA: hypothetical protein VNX29_17865 [Kaistia sp.]|nr:hypothetical protein [Kaistia sp.]
MTTNSTQNNIICGPWGAIVQRKRRGNMSRAERQIVDAFIHWLAGTLAFLSNTGREFLRETEARAGSAEGELITTDFDHYLTNVKEETKAGLLVVRARRVNLVANMPAVPEVWPENFDVAFARSVMASLLQR